MLRRDRLRVSEGMRRCKACGLPKALDAFRLVRAKSRHKEYRRQTCRLCENRAHRERRRGKPEKRKPRLRKYRPRPWAWKRSAVDKLVKMRTEYLARIRRASAKVAELDAEIARLRGDQGR